MNITEPTPTGAIERYRLFFVKQGVPEEKLDAILDCIPKQLTYAEAFACCKALAPKASPKISFDSVLPIPVGTRQTATIPFPISNEDYELILATLALWKPRLVIEAVISPAPSTTPPVSAPSSAAPAFPTADS